MQHLKARLRGVLQDAATASDLAAAGFEALSNRAAAPDALLPQTGVPLDRERQLSAAFIRIAAVDDPSGAYGTRCSTVLVAERLGSRLVVHVIERTFDETGAVTGEVSQQINATVSQTLHRTQNGQPARTVSVSASNGMPRAADTASAEQHRVRMPCARRLILIRFRRGLILAFGARLTAGYFQRDRPETHMKLYISTLGSALFAAMLFTATLAVAGGVTAADEEMVTKWAQSADTDQDHMLSKAEVLALVERAFAAADTKKAGKLDMKQVASMLREFDPRAAGVRPQLAKP